MKKIILLILTLFILTACATQLSSIDEIKDLKSGKKVIATGIVVTGAQIGTEYHINYCSKPLYIQDEKGWIQIRGELASSELLGKEVEIAGRLVIPFCEAICACDGNILIDKIKILQ